MTTPSAPIDMKLHLFEATSGKQGNWGKFAVGRFTDERAWNSCVSPLHRRLIDQIGWSDRHLWVLDLQTGEGACFAIGGSAKADLAKHRIWVCPLFPVFLEWLYRQDCAGLDALPQVLHLPDAPAELCGYRRPGRGQPVPGHRPTRHGPGDWRCTCGRKLSGGPLGPGRRGARDVMRFHRLDLWMEQASSHGSDPPGRR